VASEQLPQTPGFISFASVRSQRFERPARGRRIAREAHAKRRVAAFMRDGGKPREHGGRREGERGEREPVAARIEEPRPEPFLVVAACVRIERGRAVQVVGFEGEADQLAPVPPWRGRD
jgi:hypothetical protein